MTESSSKNSAPHLPTKPRHNLDCFIECSFDRLNFTKFIPTKRGPKSKSSYKPHELIFVASHSITELRKPLSGIATHTWTFNLKFDGERQENPGGSIKRVVILLHDSFTQSRREFKKFPIQITENGYAPFEISIIFELCPKIMISNDEDCYTEPTRKYEKYFEKTLSYQLAFPREGTTELCSSCLLKVPFYTNNPKIIHEMNIHRRHKAFKNFSKICERDKNIYRTHVTSNKTESGDTDEISQSQQRKTESTYDNTNNFQRRLHTCSHNRNVYSASVHNYSNHTRHASQPICHETKGTQNSMYKHNYYVRNNQSDKRPQNSNLKILQSFRNSTSSSNSQNFPVGFTKQPPSASFTPVNYGSVPDFSNYNISTPNTAMIDSLMINSLMINSSMIDRSESASQHSVLCSHSTLGTKDSTGIQGNHNSGPNQSRLPMNLLSNMQPNNSSYDNSIIQPNNISYENSIIQPNNISYDNSSIQTNNISYDNSIIHPNNISYDNSIIQPNNISYDNSIIQPNNISYDNSIIHPNNISYDTPINYPHSLDNLNNRNSNFSDVSPLSSHYSEPTTQCIQHDHSNSDSKMIYNRSDVFGGVTQRNCDREHQGVLNVPTHNLCDVDSLMRPPCDNVPFIQGSLGHSLAAESFSTYPQQYDPVVEDSSNVDQSLAISQLQQLGFLPNNHTSYNRLNENAALMLDNNQHTMFLENIPVPLENSHTNYIYPDLNCNFVNTNMIDSDLNSYENPPMEATSQNNMEQFKKDFFASISHIINQPDDSVDNFLTNQNDAFNAMNNMNVPINSSNYFVTNKNDAFNAMNNMNQPINSSNYFLTNRRDSSTDLNNIVVNNQLDTRNPNNCYNPMVGEGMVGENLWSVDPNNLNKQTNNISLNDFSQSLYTNQNNQTQGFNNFHKNYQYHDENH